VIVLVLGGILAVLAGLAYNLTAAVQKHETLRADAPASRLLPALARRPLWLLALLLDLCAWVGQVAALTLAPIALAVPLMAAGAALLVLLGVRWLGETFGRLELMAVALVSAGAAAAAVAAGATSPARAPLGATTQLVVGALAAVAALLSAWRRGGVALGTAAGCLYAATAIYSKEVGDRVASHGFTWRTVIVLLASPAPYLLAGFGVAALWLLQVGYQRANAATVSAAETALETVGPIIAGFLLYHEAWPSGAGGPVLAAGIAATALGATLLAPRRQALTEQPTQPEPSRRRGERGRR
jgi:drug/metabolite transporter (DMT)-like permease